MVKTFDKFANGEIAQIEGTSCLRMIDIVFFYDTRFVFHDKRFQIQYHAFAVWFGIDFVFFHDKRIPIQYHAFAFWFSIGFVFFMTKDSQFNTMRLRFGLVLTLCFS